MRFRAHGWRRLAGTAAVLLSGSALTIGAGDTTALGDTSTVPVPPVPATTVPDTTPQPVTVRVSAVPGDSQPLPAGFLGFSIEFSALHAYLGRDPQSLDPVFLALLRGIDQGHAPILRVGGNSSDDTWSPLPGVIPPPAVTYGLTPDWFAVVNALVQRTDARLILGVNLAADDAQSAGVMARALVQGIDVHHIEALEIGNEPDLYEQNPWYQLPSGATVTRRSAYSYRAYLAELAHWSALMPALPLAGGVFAKLNWLPRFSRMAAHFRRISTVTAHRYALTNCGVPPTSPLYPTIPNLLSTAATSGLTAPLAPFARTLHAEGLNLRIDELNSASCEGAAGVSDAFASALWIVDALFGMAGAGVDGVNIHTLPGSLYAPFSFARDGRRWVGTVNPLYYGLAFFARAFPAGAQLLRSDDSSTEGGGDVKAFTTQTPAGILRTTLINEDAARPAQVTLTLPTGGPLSAQTLTAPSLSATSGVTLGGQAFSAPTATGQLTGTPVRTRLEPAGGTYTLVVPAASAVLLTSTG